MNIFVSFILSTVIACASGFVFSTYVIGTSTKKTSSLPQTTAQNPTEPGVQLKLIGPVLTNLKEPPNVYIRLEAAVLLEQGDSNSPAMISQISDDFLGYLRSVSLNNLEGAGGYHVLKEELTERARLRTKGAARDLFIQTLIVE